MTRYSGSWLGIGWILLMPMVMLAIYTLVFQHVFQAKWPQAQTQSSFDFALNLYAGLIIFGWTSEQLGRAPGLLIEQPNLITKVVFPLPVLGWSSLLASFCQTCISCVIWLVACLAGGFEPRLSWLLIPVVFVSFGIWLLGLSWLLSSMGVYLRDLRQLVALCLSGLMFLSPVFYPVSSLPQWLAPIAHYNPLTASIESLRAAVLGAGTVAIDSLAINLLAGVVCSVLGLLLFLRVQDGFADVL